MSAPSALAMVPQQQVIHGYTDEYVSLLKRAVLEESGSRLTEAELGLFLYRAWHSGLDPLSKQIYAIKRFHKKLGREVLTIQTGIDGYRAIARRTVAYAGSDAGKFSYDDDGRIRSCLVTVYELVGGMRVGYEGEAFMAEYYPEANDFMWGRMPHNQLAKCAEALALRKMAPAQLGGIYIPEEMDQAYVEVGDGTQYAPPAPAPREPAPPRTVVTVTSTAAPSAGTAESTAVPQPYVRPAPVAASSPPPPSAPPPPPRAPASDYRPPAAAGAFAGKLKTEPGTATLRQTQMFYRVAEMDLGWTREEAEAYLINAWGTKDIGRLSMSQLSASIDQLMAMVKAAAKAKEPPR